MNAPLGKWDTGSGDTGLDSTVCEMQLKIENPHGLHMRPAMQFVDLASGFASSIQICHGAMEVDGKSIMHVTMLGAAQGSQLTIRAEGADAGDAIQAIRELVKTREFLEE